MSRIEGHKEFTRDDSNNSIINSDTNAYTKAISMKERIIRQTNEINTLRIDVHNMKEMLIKLSEKING
tara:strand:- start:376 stop:579 length:204 start_codon:yes stop_codon:yes gene_type:complete